MLAREIERVQRCRSLDEVAVATTANRADDAIEALARSLRVPCFRGDEHDVLTRYVKAARMFQADLVVRITADCPLIDPLVIDGVVDLATNVDSPCDYASNTLTRTYPRGLDVEALHTDVLERVARIANSAPAHEHVTWFIHHERPDLFILRGLEQSRDDSDLRWTVDEPDDLELVRTIWRKARLSSSFMEFDDLVRLVRKDTKLALMNAHVRQKV